MAMRDELVRRAQAGDRDALVRLVEREQAHVYTLAMAVTRNWTDAADATQETFVRMLRSLNTFRADGDAAFSTWLHRLTINVCVDDVRQRRRAPMPLHAQATAARGVPICELADNDASVQPEQRALQNESAAEVRAALATLPPAQRAAMTLRYLEDTSYEQAAALLGLPINTVKSHIHRARQSLGRRLSAAV